MTARLKYNGMMTQEGERFVREVLAREFACNATVDDIEAAMSDQTNLSIGLVVDWEGVSLTVSTDQDEYTHAITIDDLTFDDYSAEMLGRRVYSALSEGIKQYNHDLSVAYEMTDDRYYEDDYDDYNDDDLAYGLDEGLW